MLILKENKGRRILSFLIALIAVFCLLPISALAAEGDSDLNRGSLSALYLVDQKPVEGIEFGIYKIANFEGDNEYSWTSDFAKYNVTAPDNWNPEGLNSMKETLAGYISRDNLCPLTSVKTTADGKAIFDDLDLGMYLVVGKQHEEKKDGAIITHNPAPFIVFFPYFDEKTQSVSYAADLEVKHESSSELDTVSRHVVKVWSDKGYTSNRPSSVKVNLLQDGRRYETVELNSSNNWRYTWDDLDGGHIYKLVESEVGGNYTTTTTEEGLTYIVVNTFNPPPTETIKETPVPTTEIIEREVPVIIRTTEPSQNTIIQDPAVPMGEKIPQTGQLLWPVPALSILGIINLFFGMIGTKKKEGKENA